MFLGKVIGTVWSTVKWPELQGQKLLVVRPYSLGDLTGLDVPPSPENNNNDGVVCADTLGAGIGEDVLVAYGHAARVAIAADGNMPIDAAVVAIVDHLTVGDGAVR